MLASTPAAAAGPNAGACIAASNGSNHSADQHKLLAERAQLLVCASPSCPAAIRMECESRIEKVNAEIPTVIFLAKDGAGADVTFVKVTMDGDKVADQLDGTALSVDPGEHTFVFETAGQGSITKKILVVQGQKDRREQVTFGAGSPPPTPSSSAAPVHPVAPEPPPLSPSRGMRTQQVLGLGAGGLGIVGLGLGTVFGVLTSSEWAQAKTDCGGNTTLCANVKVGQSDRSNAETYATISTVGFIAGGALVATGAVLYLTGGNREANAGVVVRPSVGPGWAGLAFVGEF